LEDLAFALYEVEREEATSCKVGWAEDDSAGVVAVVAALGNE
jgi:hypothetical protein